MHTATAFPIANLPGIDWDLRDREITRLNRMLATLTDLAAAYKQAHWNILGPNFAALHALFDQFADETRSAMDLAAERATALGGTAQGTLQVATEQTVLHPFPPEERDQGHLLDALARRVDRVVDEVRQAVAASTEEPVTQDLYIELGRTFEKQRWMLLAHLPRPGGNGRRP